MILAYKIDAGAKCVFFFKKRYATCYCLAKYYFCRSLLRDNAPITTKTFPLAAAYCEWRAFANAARVERVQSELVRAH